MRKRHLKAEELQVEALDGTVGSCALSELGSVVALFTAQVGRHFTGICGGIAAKLGGSDMVMMIEKQQIHSEVV